MRLGFTAVCGGQGQLRTRAEGGQSVERRRACRHAGGRGSFARVPFASCAVSRSSSSPETCARRLPENQGGGRSVLHSADAAVVRPDTGGERPFGRGIVVYYAGSGKPPQFCSAHCNSLQRYTIRKAPSCCRARRLSQWSPCNWAIAQPPRSFSPRLRRFENCTRTWANSMSCHFEPCGVVSQEGQYLEGIAWLPLK